MSKRLEVVLGLENALGNNNLDPPRPRERTKSARSFATAPMAADFFKCVSNRANGAPKRRDDNG